MKVRLLLAVVATVLSVGTASADFVIFSGGFDETELSGPNRLNRNAIASVAGVQKSFPGTLGNAPPYFFDTLTINVVPGTVVSVDSTVQDPGSFMSLYDTMFSPANLATNYLGDQGASNSSNDFSVTAPASGVLVFVVNDVNNGGDENYSATITFTAPAAATATPVPPTVALILIGAAGLAGVRRRRGASA